MEVWNIWVSYLQMLSASHKTGTYSGWSFTFSAQIFSILAIPFSSFKSLKLFKKFGPFVNVFAYAERNPSERGEVMGQRDIMMEVISEKGKCWQTQRRSGKLEPWEWHWLCVPVAQEQIYFCLCTRGQ